MSRPTWEQWLADERPELHIMGDGHAFRFLYGSVDSYPDKGWLHYQDGVNDLVIIGIMENHRTADGFVCGGYASFVRPPRPSEHEATNPLWKVQSIEPLTITPSLQCRSCANHGFITEGQWVSA